MKNRLPSLRALRAFEAAGRHGSFTAAATELNVSAGAVGHLVKTLETQLDVMLFERRNREIRLTPAGAQLLSGIGDAFERLRAALTVFQRRIDHRPLTISTCSSFAAKWLLPRLERFQERHPTIEFRLDSSNETVNLQRGDIDAAIRYGSGDYPDLFVRTLFRAEDMFPVCSPALREGKQPLREPSDLARHTLIYDDAWQYFNRPTWAMWLQLAGVGDLRPRRRLEVEFEGLALQAAIAGQGVALVSNMLAEDDLRDGRLIKPFTLSAQSRFGYHFVCAPSVAQQPRLAVFRDWLLAEARGDAELGAPDESGEKADRVL